MERLIEKARAGDGRALEILIDTLCNETAEEGITPNLIIWANSHAPYLKEWDAEDIVARMREWIWRIVMDTKHWPTLKYKDLQRIAWRKLHQVVITQDSREHTLKRTGILLNIDDIYWQPKYMYWHPKLEMNLDMKGIHFKRDLEILNERLTPIQRFIVEQIVDHDKSLTEIAKLLSQEQGRRWYTELVRLQIKKIRKAMVSLEKRPFEKVAVL